MNTLIIEPNSKADYQIFVSLAKRLNVTFREEKVKAKKERNKNEEKFLSFFGVLDDIDTEKMIKDIEESRTTKDIDISWTK
ncbi:MAG: hypothetical protein U5N85_01310 [Arcicella sp.]|nr:hypothetical protein [Arcicella sp.]